MKEHKKVKQYKESPFMNTLRIRTFRKYPDAEITYGSETSPKRKDLGLEKTHYNDAVAITGVESINENAEDVFYIKQFRKKNVHCMRLHPERAGKLLMLRRSGTARTRRNFVDGI